MKIIRQASLSLFLLLGLLAACGPASRPTQPAEITKTAPVETPTALPPAAPIPAPYTVSPPNLDQQVYTDPAGWYTLNFPVDLKMADQPNIFSSAQGETLETAYLPEVGSMSTAINVCSWLANVKIKDEKATILWLPPCSVVNETDAGYKTRYTVYENPGAEPDQRFVYVKTGGYMTSSGYLGDRITFSWLKPVAATRPATTPSAAENAFWKNAPPMPVNISVSEYTLPSEAQDPIHHDGLQYVPPQAGWPKRVPSATPGRPSLPELGYEWKIDESVRTSQLYRDGKILFDQVDSVSPVYTLSTASGPVHAFAVTTDYSDFLIQNDGIHLLWEEKHGMDPGLPPIVYQGELLWAKVTRDAHIEIRNRDGKVLFRFATWFDASLPPIQFRSWQDHWVLQAGDFVTLDGELLNTQLGFEEIFEWSLMRDKPIYFFRKGSRVGISYDGQILPLQYEDVAHGLCCSPAQNNPDMGADTLQFFGKRDGVWYYVVVKFK